MTVRARIRGLNASATMFGCLAVVGASFLVGCRTPDGYSPLSVPERAKKSQVTPTTQVPDYSSIDLVRARGTTTTAPPSITPGRAVLRGVVNGPNGPVAGATVHLERLVGDAAVSGVLTTAEDGSWAAADIQGGRYRVRAWLNPDLFQSEPEVLFLESSGENGGPLELRLQSISQPSVEAMIAPNPAVVGLPVNLVIRLTRRQVDSDGYLRLIPLAGSPVRLAPSGRWTVQSGVAATDSGGRATFRLTCTAAGAQGLAVVSNDVSLSLPLPDCASASSTSSSAPAPTAPSG